MSRYMPEKKITLKSIQKPANDISKLKPGTIVRRKNKKKDQQGCLVRFEDDCPVLINVIDLKNGKLFANEGVLKPEEKDELFFYDSSFKKNSVSKAAIEIIKEWPVYKKNETLQSIIIQFVCITFVPEQILEWKKKDTLKKLFIPIKQRFRLGNYKERRSTLRVYRDKFKFWLDSLNRGEYITYVAFIPQQSTQFTKFFTTGVNGHRETESNLFSTPYSFKPSHGGHIRLKEFKNDKKCFIVDAGSDYIGRGVKTPLHSSQQVAKALNINFREYIFTPVKGRDAFGSQIYIK